ncbi:unnamed protein product [Fraxinus pennsylvanica]|uniref:Uncharacterized protein n=1 Tax=Fraxinus pennsylvanica TaxID=56036 RepID=A0AAD2EAE6_9LAMI|nr:unnamed protein product [Fraxinus pennsylvanica]
MKGLKKKVLKSIQKLIYGEDEEAKKFSNCAICLAEFAAGKELIYGEDEEAKMKSPLLIDLCINLCLLMGVVTLEEGNGGHTEVDGSGDGGGRIWTGLIVGKKETAVV